MNSIPPFFAIRNFEKFQHYHDRRPPWIKLYRDLWDDPRFFSLSVAHRYILLSLFVVASQHENKIPSDPKWLRSQLLINQHIPLQLFIDTGWIEPLEQSASNPLAASNVLASCYPSRARGETETETETETENKTPCIPLLPPPPESARKPVARKTRAPDTIPISEEMQSWAAHNAITVDLDAETAAMLDHHRGKGNLHIDWIAAWRTWMRNTKKFTNRGNGNGHKTKTDRNAEAAQRLLSRLDQQDREREQRGTLRSDPGDLLGTLTETHGIGNAAGNGTHDRGLARGK